MPWPTPAQQQAIDAWWARHPILKNLMWAIIVAILIGLFWVIAAGTMKVWPTWYTYYQAAGGWLLNIETPTGAPITVDTFASQDACEQIRAMKIRQAYQSQRAIPTLSCVPYYQGWRRLLYATQVTMEILDAKGTKEKK